MFLAAIDYAYGYSLSFLEERLDPTMFLRLHRNNIVNIKAIRALSKGPRVSVTLVNGVELPVARDRKALLRSALAP